MRITLIMLLSFVVCISCKTKFSKKNNELTGRGLYFVVQPTNVKNDTIYFHTISIYAYFQYLEVSDSQPNIVVVEPKLSVKHYFKGYLKGFRKKDLGKVLVLYTLSQLIENDNFVNFSHVVRPGSIIFRKMYSIAE